MSVTVRVPAKVNLHLGVGGVRADGFHELVTVFQAVSLYDIVEATPAASLGLTLTGADTRGIPQGTDNLALRAAVQLAERLGVEPAVHLRIDKQIPVAGGMAGGSADAAAALVACARLWGADTDHPAIAEVAERLGSDVPFALSGGNALGTGRGERITPLAGHGRFHWVLAEAEQGLSTPLVFGEFDRRAARAGAPAADTGQHRTALLRSFADVLDSGEAARLAPLLGNDLQDAALALRPELDATLRLGRRAGALGALVSGSGPTCAFLTEGAASAADLSEFLLGSGCCRAVRTAHGPVPGATVIDPADAAGSLETAGAVRSPRIRKGAQ
ncbi:4-(cytidine 5'-diphospho)-2-C-methyl-D-erythritol kinase [Streptomyces beihaiensis]|uniref:4-diphosphocytidyl-2-C-methyl-D-erythritol kinase n=1 Tax=Streptomyces beihaiensis TaxID=2984495 RepID=A0ABT3TSA7_9ACTN|nr:4-(cytidine 5'-diphospho)-2-C-methyl-D-erythritol kinase [Streptomyces beihaiensis]MCX3059914.1 4-(cytidine 5'-diphospho)-2-C-methyl-D-erythritol kinase [Streptomyces beihaiensis]